MNRSVRESIGQKMKLYAILFITGHILDSKRIMEPVKMFWIFEKENIYPKEIRALRLLLMYYWDRIAHYPDVEDLRLLDTEPMSYYYTVQHS